MEGKPVYGLVVKREDRYTGRTSRVCLYRPRRGWQQLLDCVGWRLETITETYVGGAAFEWRMPPGKFIIGPVGIRVSGLPCDVSLLESD